MSIRDVNDDCGAYYWTPLPPKNQRINNEICLFGVMFKKYQVYTTMIPEPILESHVYHLTFLGNIERR